MRTFWLHPISGTVGTVISLIAQRFISFNSSSQDGGESKPRNHRLASETQGLQWLATPRSTDGSKKWWTDWCFLFFQNGWYQIRWHHMTRIHNNLKIEFGDFVNMCTACLCLPAGHALHRLWPRVEGEPFQRGCNGPWCHVANCETPSLSLAHETFQHAIPANVVASVVIWNSCITVDGSEIRNNHLECIKP